jgi:hypothetical protein
MQCGFINRAFAAATVDALEFLDNLLPKAFEEP